MPVRGKNGGNKGQGSKWITRKRRCAIYKRDRHQCVWCTRPVGASRLNRDDDATLDHVMPREHGGTNKTHNLVTACMKCNRRRGTMPAYQFAVEIWKHTTGVGTIADILYRVLCAILSPLPDALPRTQGGEVGGD
jgi:hypothetical protein